MPIYLSTDKFIESVVMFFKRQTLVFLLPAIRQNASGPRQELKYLEVNMHYYYNSNVSNSNEIVKYWMFPSFKVNFDILNFQ